MKLILNLILFGLFICGNLSAQQYDKAVVTDLKYYLAYNTDAGINKHTFPFYFDSDKFNQKIRQVIEEKLTSKYGVSSVEFIEGEKVNYKEGIQLEQLNLKEKVDRKEKSTVYVAIVSNLYAGITINDYTRYTLSTKVKVLNHKSRKIYKNKTKQPFDILQGEEITGIVMLGEMDFQDIYINTLEDCLSSDIPVLPLISVDRPPTLKYNEFLVNSTRFMQTENDRTISFFDENGEGFDAIEYKGDFWRSYNNNTNIATYETGQLLWQNKVKRTYDLTNLIQEQDYQVKIKGGDTEWLNFITIHEDVKVIFKNDTASAGEFTYHPRGLLKGKFNDRNCGVEWIYENSVVEVFIEDDLIGLIQPLTGKRYIYFPNDLSDEDVALLINLVFAYDYGMFVQEIIDMNSD